MPTQYGNSRLSEAEIVRWAASLEVSPGVAMAPAVASAARGRRPVISKVPGPRLDARLHGGSATLEQLQHVGRALAVLHAAAPPGRHSVMLESLPWNPLPLRLWSGLSSTQRRLLGALHRDSALRHLGSVTHTLLTKGPVWCHGDARTNNVVVDRNGVPYFIDWECAGLGRPEADLGAFCGSLITDALVPMDAPHGAEAQAELRSAMDTAAIHVRAALSAYRGAGGAELNRELLAASVGCCLLARAFLRAAMTGRDRIVAALHSIGRGLLKDSERWEAIDR
ncbi:aminoglycoside phosphotransferase family protein [Streptomyces sp. NPDC015345]|uniref:aminoglycoside phosphotransferase family protein n=1 Tax=Streptomyces sp. NPDC015345 TaxID=3364953 RepID=UPI0036FC9D23